MNNPIIVKQILNAHVDAVWRAITDENLMKEWYFDIPDFCAKPGALFSFRAGSETEKYYHFCEILEAEPQKTLVHTWTYPELSSEKTIVKWVLESYDGGTTVTLTHSGIENFKALGKDFQRESFEKGWTGIVTSMLKNYVEKAD